MHWKDIRSTNVANENESCFKLWLIRFFCPFTCKRRVPVRRGSVWNRCWGTHRHLSRYIRRSSWLESREASPTSRMFENRVLVLIPEIKKNNFYIMKKNHQFNLHNYILISTLTFIYEHMIYSKYRHNIYNPLFLSVYLFVKFPYKSRKPSFEYTLSFTWKNMKPIFSQVENALLNLNLKPTETTLNFARILRNTFKKKN